LLGRVTKDVKKGGAPVAREGSWLHFLNANFGAMREEIGDENANVKCRPFYPPGSD